MDVKQSTVTSTDGASVSFTTLGSGPGLVLVGGAFGSAQDYLPLAEALSRSFEVFVIDRRGRGRSAAQGPDYSISDECDDLAAVQAATGARRVFGHSYGGLIALEAARRSRDFDQVAVYEPGVSIAGSIPLEWLEGYRQALAAGDTRAAFAEMVLGAGQPRVLALLPRWYVRLVLRAVIRRERWAHLEPLLGPALAEHEQVRALADTAARYATVTAQVLLMGGAKSPARGTSDLFAVLSGLIPDTSVRLIPGAAHLAPTEAAAAVAPALLEFFSRDRN